MARRGRPTRTTNQPDLTQLVTDLQRQFTEQQQIIAEQQQTINTLMSQQQGNAVPPPATPVAPPVVSAPSTSTAPGMRPEAYLIQWQRLKPEPFSGSCEPWDAQAWFKTVESIVEMLDWPEQEKVKCVSFCFTGDARMWWDRVKSKRSVSAMKWKDFEEEFFEEFFHMRVTNRHYDEFTEFRQGELTVNEAVKKFNRLARLCPELVGTEKERVRLMLKMLRPEIAMNVAGGVNKPQTSEELVSSALVTEHYLNSIKQQKKPSAEVKTEHKGHFNKGHVRKDKRKWNNAKGGPANKKPKFTTCAKCGRLHPGECLVGTNKCFICGVEGHKAQFCPKKFQAPSQQPPQQQMQYQKPPAQLHYMQAALDGPQISQGRLEAPPATTNARVFSMTKEDVANASTVVTGQIFIYSQYATALFDTGATHSFISMLYAKKIEIPLQVLDGKFLTTLPSGEVMASTHMLRAVPIGIAGRELYCDLIVLDMQDFDVILGMDFLSKYGASIECRKRRVSQRGRLGSSYRL
ncbi:uncharacterized protein LOC141827277 [Curcuma longa]|uniref:uncharacterized protein LOC141827277 n=1 Tax=Curcuma longa TaxID=136217 RepID=UPI003D9E5116